jgi:hypothetical protein
MIIRTPPRITNKSIVLKYIDVDLWSWLKELYNGLFMINFNDNFQSFTVNNLTIPAGTEIAISNQFGLSYPGSIPSGRIIVRQQGDANIIDGLTIWNEKQVFLRNPSANDATISVIFFK